MSGISAQADTLTLGGLLAAVSGVAVVGIAVLLFPLLKPTSEPLALAYVRERVIELVLQLLFFLVVPLLMIAAGDRWRDGTMDASTAQSLGLILKALHELAIVVLYLITSVGGTILAVLLYRSHLVPRWIAALALFGYPVLFVGCVLDLFDVTNVTAGAGLVAIAPGGLFELILPIRLLAKGFDPAVRALPRTQAPQIVRTG